jgi:hypothetical protein
VSTGTFRMTWPITDPRAPLDALIGQAQHDLAQALDAEGLVRCGVAEWRITNQRGPRLTAIVPVAGITDDEFPPPPRELQPHGTHAAYARHKAQGTAPCPACTQGERAYQRARKRRDRLSTALRQEVAS